MTKPSKGENISQQTVAASDERLRALLIATSDVIYSMSADWKVMRQLDGRGFIKDNYEPIVDWQLKNVYPDDLEAIRIAIAHAIKEKKIFQLEHRVIRVDNTPGWTFSRAVPILDDRGDIIEWFGVASDITERKQAEEELRKTKDRSDQQRRIYETITAATPDLMYVFDLNYRFTYANAALLSMWGKTWDDAVGKGLLENGYEPWHAEMHEREIDHVKATKQSIRGEVSFPHATLGKRVYDYIFTPVLDENGEVEAVAGTTRDITDRKRFEESLARSSEELRTMNEEMATVNEEIVATNEEQAASNEALILINEELEFVNQQLLKARQKIEESEVALRLALDAANFGTWFIHSVTREFITDARLKELFGYYPDEQLSIEQALAQIPEEYRGFVATKLENAIYHNGDYDVSYPVIGLHDNNLRWLRSIGNLKADPSGAFSAFTGVVMDITDQYLAAKKVERAEESLRMAIDAARLGSWFIEPQTKELRYNATLANIFGYEAESPMTYEQAIGQVSDEYRSKISAEIEHAIATRENYDIVYKQKRFNDGEMIWLRSLGKVSEDEEGNYTIFSGVVMDVTEQKQDEQRKNDFIGMVSHELKTPLTSLTAIVQLANVKLRSNPDQFLAGAMEKANVQVKKMSNMINGFLNVSRLESGKMMISKTAFALDDLIKETIKEHALTLSTHTLQLIHYDNVVVDADRDKIGSVISNLISNAIKYSSKGTRIEVQCELVDDTVMVSVKDQGIGIKAEDIPNVFDRYFRVESNNSRHISGFGIGLYLSAEIIRRHNGQIWAESKPGIGSTFYFSLPI